MITLALEFSSSRRSAALFALPAMPNPVHPAELEALAFVSENHGQTTRPIPLIERALAESGIERESVACIAVGLGPGSYTGIRSAIALAQGWALAREIKLLGISSADAIAWKARKLGHLGAVRVAIDAQRGEFYSATYNLAHASITCLEPLRLMERRELEQPSASTAPLMGPDLTKSFPHARDIEPGADAMGELALGCRDFVAGEKLEPIYLRQTSFVKAPPPRFIS